MAEPVDLNKEAGKENEQTLANLSPAEEATRKDEVTCRGTNKIIFFCPFDFLFGHIINILLTELGQSVRENLHLGCWYRPHCIRSVLATLVKILPYRHRARLIRTN